MAAEPAHVRWYGVVLRDRDGYQRYREAMTPLLHAHGGSFGHDFEVSRVLRSEPHAAFDRVFSLRFPGRLAADRFFDDPAYRAVRARLFEPAVASVSLLGSYTPD